MAGVDPERTYLVRSGVDLALPPLRARGDHARLTRGPAQFVLGVQFALIFG